MATRGEGSSPGGAEHYGAARSATARASNAQKQARLLAARLAETAEGLAETLDDVAHTEEDHAKRSGSASARERAQRTRAKAEGERRDARKLREAWDPPQD